MTKVKSVLAIIPARSGSKGVLHKNLRLLAGKPLIGYAIEVGLKAPSVDRVIVTTDDAEIADVARKYGAEVPFMRPAELAGDDVPDQPVFQHALKWLETQENYQSQFVLNLRCTTPLKTIQDIETVVQKLRETGCDSVRTMTRVRGDHHPYWMFKERNGLVETFIDGLDMTKFNQRQLLPAVYRLNGVVDGAKRAVMMNHPRFWGDSMEIVEIPEARSYDIDTELDFKFLEFILMNQSDDKTSAFGEVSK